MALRRLLGCLPAAVLAVCAWSACKGDDKGADKSASTLDSARCERLAKACGDTDPHVEKLAQECTQAAGKLAERGCAQNAIALYDCYEKQLCGKDDKVWTLDDLRVLAERHGVCAAERDTLRACVAK